MGHFPFVQVVLGNAPPFPGVGGRGGGGGWIYIDQCIILVISNNSQNLHMFLEAKPISECNVLLAFIYNLLLLFIAFYLHILLILLEYVNTYSMHPAPTVKVSTCSACVCHGISC